MGRSILLLGLLALSLAGCTAGDEACNAWLEGRAGLDLPAGSPAYEACQSAARHRQELRQDARSRGGA